MNTEQTLDTELEPQRQIQLRMWLTENPQSSEEYFNEKIWVHLRASIIKQRAEPVGVKAKRRPAKKRAAKKAITKKKAG